MASVYKRKNGKYAIRYRDESGTWRAKVTSARSKAEAKRLAHEAEQHCERVRLGLEPRRDKASDLTLRDLLEWWLAAHSVHMRSHRTNVGSIGKHVLTHEISKLLAHRVTSGDIVRFLDGKRSELEAKTINNLRGYLHAAYETGREAEVIGCPNPVSRVKRQRVPKKMHEFLRPAEAAAVLAELPAHWRSLFAVAIYQGLRKGELFALSKTDVDLEARLMVVRASHDATTTKGGHADMIPIAAECVPYLETAIATSRSELVFPASNGRRRSKDTKLGDVLRRAMARAGVVVGYEHRCRRKSCRYKAFAPDQDAGACPKCGFRLWVVPLPKKVRFHDLRHTTASLLTMAGASTAAVQKIMRHADVRITADTYTHLTEDYLRSEIDRLRLPEATRLVTTLLPPTRTPTTRGGPPRPTASQPSPTRCARHDSNVRPSGSKPDALSN